MPLLPRQRLIVCLDGTWNNRDDSTNVLHHYSLIQEGLPPSASADTVVQRKYYDQGVGTGILDGITGGAFGVGLEENVREAYNWLVENFHDADDSHAADEIYIFGFSRGAYTARSLVGFIGQCGLLRRGAPLTVRQLWQNYGILGRAHEKRAGFWERLAGEQLPPHIRQISELMLDPWSQPNSPRRNLLKRVRNRSEELLVLWSRRVRVTFLGIYDTVGALGADALAIPGITSKHALHHNMRPSAIVERCRHALAIDEHRTSFNHTPLLQYQGHFSNQAKWDAERESWWERIEQRWFLGAHSNIGGGYPDNELAQHPLHWIFEESKYRQLRCESKPAPPAPSGRPGVTDSYAAFAAPFWKEIFRGKRNYRRICPEPAILARRAGTTTSDAGYTLQSINETLSPTVHQFLAHAAIGAAPPNLVAHARRQLAAEPDPAKQDPRLRAIVEKAGVHDWLASSVACHVWLVLWATFAAAGFLAVVRFFAGVSVVHEPFYATITLAMFFIVVDWLESRGNFEIASGNGSPLRRALLDSLYWLRTLGFVLAVFGVVACGVYFLREGWNAPRETTLAAWKTAVASWIWVPLWSTVVLLVLRAIETTFDYFAHPAVARLAQERQWRILPWAALLPTTVACALATATFCLGDFLSFFFPWLADYFKPAQRPPIAAYAGLILVLQVGCVCLLNTFAWTVAPMRRARFGSLVALMFSATAGAVQRRFETWISALEQPYDVPGSRARGCRVVCEAVRESLWRDTIGLVPIYLLVLGFGAWLSTNIVGPRLGVEIPSLHWLAEKYYGIELCYLIAMATAVFDWLEDALHFSYVRCVEPTRGSAGGARPLFFVPPLAIVCTVLKFAGLAVLIFATGWTLFHGTRELLNHMADVGWRGVVAVGLTAFGAVSALVIVGYGVVYRFLAARHRAPGPGLEPATAAAP